MRNPIQPIGEDEKGVLRFKRNSIVCHLLDTHPSCDMNKIASLDFTNDDRQQFAQLIGYSLYGYGELLSYVGDEDYSAAAHMAAGMDEKDARIAALEQRLGELREAAGSIQRSIAAFLEIHPDDLTR